MSIPGFLYGTFDGNDLAIMQGVFDCISAESWFTSQQDQREEFARFVIVMYGRGLIIPDRLESLCRVVARKQFSREERFCELSGKRILLVEDEFLVALDAEERLRELGVTVVGPVSTVSDALRIVDTDDEPLDGALLDIVLNGQTVYPVAAFLAMKQIPIAFVTGYEGRQVPAFYRSVPTFLKPADWGLMASAVSRA
ncbi:CheY-like chemotaxis protein [Rhizobium sp. BK181]|uniref:hypothetical protein n=1 Tax=Rhizobium sp. BK181 TaxID=2587072 RepID=UPI001622B3E7|nr:hypothetical protein [Rhizobium sp. BK181]MBB3318239.1 CheY-like chemotaxis protein [Rhizobium sp. BK181]